MRSFADREEAGQPTRAVMDSKTNSENIGTGRPYIKK
jgi:hypothetical protein